MAKAAPEALWGLPVFESDPDLCAKWKDFSRSLRIGFPELDLHRELAKCHAWCMGEASSREIKNLTKLILSWMTRAEKNRVDDPEGEIPDVTREEWSRRATEQALEKRRRREKEAEDPEALKAKAECLHHVLKRWPSWYKNGKPTPADSVGAE